MTQVFWAMGGYARYVWPCIAFALLILAWNLWAAQRAYQQALASARRSVAMAST